MLSLQELQNSSISELQQEFNLAKQVLFKHKLEIKTGQSKNIHLYRGYKKYIATILTIIKEINKKENIKKTNIKTDDSKSKEKKEE